MVTIIERVITNTYTYEVVAKKKSLWRILINIKLATNSLLIYTLYFIFEVKQFTVRLFLEDFF